MSFQHLVVGVNNSKSKRMIFSKTGDLIFEG